MRDAQRKYLAPRPESVGLAREFVTRALTAWGIGGERAEDVRLCVSELASNALLHGTDSGLGFLVRLTAADGFVRLEVHDGRCLGKVPGPRLRRPTGADLSGRGLLIVEMLADDWGVDEREPSGKVVWSRFRAVPGDAGSARP